MIKKLIYILILFTLFSHCTYAMQQGYLEFGKFSYEFQPGSEQAFLEKAEQNMKLFEKAKTSQDKEFYLNEAMRYYFMLSQVDSNIIEAPIGLGRIYDEMQRDRFAQKNFFVALNLDNKNPAANFYFANYYYKRSEFITALFYYKRAYSNGYQNKYDVNYKIATIYEKLADIESAQKYYKNALRLKPSDKDLKNKIRLLDDLNYSESQYYLFNKSGKRGEK